MATPEDNQGGRNVPGEITRDVLGRHVFIQPRSGFRFSIDAVLLAHFAGRLPSPVRGMVADLGAGCGVVTVLLHARGLAGPFRAVEMDPLAAHCCRENLQGAGVEGLVVEADLAEPHPGLPPGAFSQIVTNPPFAKTGHGRLPPDPSKARARFDLALEPDRLWAAASRLLPAGGRLAVCWTPFRLPEALEGMNRHRLTPKRLRLVHGRADLPAKVVFIEAVKDGGAQLDVEPPLIVHEGREHTPEVRAIYRELCGLDAEGRGAGGPE